MKENMKENMKVILEHQLKNVIGQIELLSLSENISRKDFGEILDKVVIDYWFENNFKK